MAPRPRHEQVNDAYTQQSSAPPSTGRIRGVKREEKRTRTQNPPRQQTTYRDSVRNTKIEKTRKKEELEPKFGIAGRRVRRAYTRLKVGTKKLPGEAADIALRAKATKVNASIWSWGIPLWLTFQLPFVLFSNILFFVAYIEKAAVAGTQKTFAKGDDGAIIEGTKAVFRFTFGLIKKAADSLVELYDQVTGFNFGDFFSALLPSNLWGIFFTIIFAYAFAIFFIIWAMYTFNGLKGLFGKGTTFKMLSVILMFAGYLIPLANMFPWFMLWTAVVWRYPK